MKIGDWFEFGKKIYEIIGETPTDWICKEILYNVADPTLRYGETVVIGKEISKNE